MTTRTTPDHEVIIVGAGFSGIGSAIKLSEIGISDYLVLEQGKFKPDRTGTGTLGVGSNYLSSSQGKLKNHQADVKIDYCWSGMISYPFDKLPHVGVRDGVYYTMGHCGTGVPLSTYLGHKLALKILGDKDGATPFDDDDSHHFPARVFYGGGNPWFVPLAARVYHFQDKRDIDRSMRKVRAH